MQILFLLLLTVLKEQPSAACSMNHNCTKIIDAPTLSFIVKRAELRKSQFLEQKNVNERLKQRNLPNPSHGNIVNHGIHEIISFLQA